MFFSSIEADYTKMGFPKAIVRALDFLKNTDVKSLPVGSKNPLEGDKMYYNVDEVMTKDFSETKPESHKDYIDIQFMVDGEENMGFFVNHGQATPLESYPERDCYFYANESIDETWTDIAVYAIIARLVRSGEFKNLDVDKALLS